MVRTHAYHNSHQHPRLQVDTRIVQLGAAREKPVSPFKILVTFNPSWDVVAETTYASSKKKTLNMSLSSELFPVSNKDVNKKKRKEVELFCAPMKPCPCCDVHQIGFPIPSPHGGQTSEYAGPNGWKFRLDMLAWVCPQCHTNLGPDQVREAAIAESQQNLYEPQT